MKALLALSLLTLPAFAQDLCEGNGVGNAFLSISAAEIGGTLDVALGSSGAPGGNAFLLVSNDLGPTTFSNPLLGTVCIASPAPVNILQKLPLDGSGSIAFPILIDSNPFQVVFPPLYAVVIVPEAGVFSISKTARISWENPDSYNPVGLMSEPRFFHTATALGSGSLDNRTKVLVAGGGGGNLLQPLGTTTTELFDPLTRTFEAGPAMSVERTGHQSVRLNDGRVLITGGNDSLGVVTTSCEIYDHDTGLLSATGALQSPRTGHRLTLLPSGLVLATGGLSDYQDAELDILTAFATSQATAELYDPVTGAWTPTSGTMVSKRTGHAQTRLPNGTVLISGGLTGAVLSQFNAIPTPTYTATCDLYDPVTDAFLPVFPMIGARAFHGQSVLANGDVLVTGGAISDVFIGAVQATSSCNTFDGSGWIPTGFLPQPLGYHTQTPLPDGRALIQGGLVGGFPTFTGSSTSGIHDGVSFTFGAEIGTNPGLPALSATPVGVHTVTPLPSGGYLFLGGQNGVAVSSGGWIYTD